MYLPRKLILTVLLLLNAVIMLAQAPGVREGFTRKNVQHPLPGKTSGIYKNQQVNVCNTWTFQSHFNSAKAELPSNVATIPTGSYIIAGSDSDATGKRGRLIKTDAAGTLSDSKELSLGTQNIALHKIQYFSNGKLYALGETTDPNTLVITPFVVVLDTFDLHIISSFRILINNSGSWKSSDLAQSSDGTFAVLIYNDSLVNVTKLDYSGSIAWSKSYKTKSKPQPVGLYNDYDDIFVAYNDVDSGFRKGIVIDLDISNGNYRSSAAIGGLADTSEFIFQSITRNNYRPRVMGYQIKNKKYSLVRMTFDPNLYRSYKEVFDINSFTPDDGTHSSENDWAEVLAANNKSNNKSIYLTFTYPDNYSSPVYSKKYSYTNPVDLCDIIRSYDGGDVMLAKEKTLQSKIVLTKIDSVGTLPGCSSIDIASTFITVEQLSAPDLITISPFIASTPPVALTLLDYTTNVVEDCKSLYCPNVPQPDTCLRTFFKQYRNNSNSIISSQIHKTNNDQLLVIARERVDPYIAFEASSFTLFDTTGKIVDAKVLTADAPIYISKTIKLRDGNYIGSGELQSAPDSTVLYIFKFDQQFNIIWQKQFRTSSQYSNIWEIMESSEGELFCYVDDDFYSASEKRFLLKLNSSGNPVWYREYAAGSSIFYRSSELTPKLTELGDFIYFKFNEGYGDLSPNLIKIAKTNGSVIWVKKYQLDQQTRGSYGVSINSLFTDSNNIYMSIRTYASSILLKISPDGEVIHSRQVKVDFFDFASLLYKGSNKLLGSLNTGGYPHSIYGVFEMDTSLNLLRKQFIKLPGDAFITDVKNFSDSVNYAVGSFLYTNPYWVSISLQKYNFNSSFASCEVPDPLINFEDFPIPVIDKTTTLNVLSLPQTANYNAVLSPGSISYSHFYCGNNQVCNKVNIAGPKIICDSSAIYNFYAKRNTNCTAIVNWIPDTTAGQIQVVSSTDSFLQLKVRQAGTFKIKAKIFASCGFVEDSIVVQATINPSLTLSLGADTAICPGNQILLNAHTGFATYRWQDGSTDSTFIVTKSGIYYVTANGGCGNTYSDTIVVNNHAPIPLDLGPDVSICIGDTAIISAPAGFISYQWLPGYNITGPAKRIAQVYPLMNTIYKLTAELTPGCFAYDSINVVVKKAPAINLGNDTSFCSGQLLTLDAGKGFDSYAWSTGATSQKISVAQQGMYYVNAFLNGCRSADTLQVLNVFPLPVFTLGNDTTLCESQQLSYTFNLRQASYVWSTGSISGSAVISVPGVYRLTVSQQGCAASDTIIVAYSHAPHVNLGNDTTLCEGIVKTLNAENVNATYQWQDLSTAPVFSVSAAGTYYVSVAINKCSVSDTIHIQYTPKPSFSFGTTPVFLCTGEQVTLSPVINAAKKYLWQDGSTSPTFIVKQQGTYTLAVSNDCGSYTNSLTVAQSDCALYMPGAFTPNNDGLNDVFRVKFAGFIKTFHLTIFNRFGNKVFETYDASKGWDGKVNSADQPIGAYVWTISLVKNDGTMNTAKGTVMLLR